MKTVGSLWLKEGRKGKFFSGILELEGRNGPKVNIMIFRNTEKKDRQPDYRIVVSDDEDGGPRRSKGDSEPF